MKKGLDPMFGMRVGCISWACGIAKGRLGGHAIQCVESCVGSNRRVEKVCVV